MLEDLSDLSDFDYESDYDDDTPLADSTRKKNGTAKLVDGDYRVRNALKPPRNATYTAKSLYDQMYQNDIDVDPEYQRDVVWPESKQISIIDSMFRNFYIPPIIFAVFISDDGSERRVCIDGKQRLTSILRFMDGQIPHKDPFTRETLWFKKTSNKKARDKLLPERYVSIFEKKQVACVEYTDLTPENEREIFSRVQMGVALMTGEKMQAIAGPMPTFIRSLMDTYLSETNLGSTKIDWDRSRGRDFHSVTQAIFVIENYPNFNSIGSTQQIDKFLRTHDVIEDWLSRKAHEMFKIFVELVTKKEYNKVFKERRIAPVEFVMICLLIAEYREHLSFAQLSREIGKMRREVKSIHNDVRSNSGVVKTMKNFIKGIKVARDDGSPSATTVIRARDNSSADGKRKRTGSEDGEVDEGESSTKKRSLPKNDLKGKWPARQPPPSNSPSSPGGSLSRPTSGRPSPSASTALTARPGAEPPVQTPANHWAAPPPPRLAAVKAAKAIARGEHAPSPPPATQQLPSQTPSQPLFTASPSQTPVPSRQAAQSPTSHTSLQQQQHMSSQLLQQQPTQWGTPSLLQSSGQGQTTRNPLENGLMERMGQAQSESQYANTSSPQEAGGVPYGSMHPSRVSMLNHNHPNGLPPRPTPLNTSWGQPAMQQPIHGPGYSPSTPNDPRFNGFKQNTRPRQGSGGFGRSDGQKPPYYQ